MESSLENGRSTIEAREGANGEDLGYSLGAYRGLMGNFLELLRSYIDIY